MVDVRTAKEYELGHIPGAINIPLLNEEERSEVGTLYKKIGREKALEVGLEIISPKLPSLYRQFMQLKEDLTIYCWRGGLRSRFVVSVLKLMDISCSQLKGGYKAYRQGVLKTLEEFTPKDFVVVDGFTGSGKTGLLRSLKEKGFPVIDLEGLASHKGSVFGDINSPPQPTQQQFENELASELIKIGSRRPILLEGESQRIGKLQIPKQFFETMDKAQRLFFNVSLEKRVENICNEYIKVTPKNFIENRVLKIEKRLGRERSKELIDEIRGGNDKIFVSRILSEYYDKTYLTCYKKRGSFGEEVVFPDCNEARIIDWLNSYTNVIPMNSHPRESGDLDSRVRGNDI